MELKDKIKLVERATWESVVAREGQEVISSPTWVQITSPFALTAFMNAVLRCELPENEIEARVASTVEHFGAKGLPFRWKVVPSTKPQGLGQVLEKHGLQLKERLFGLYADASKLKIQANPQVRVEKMNLQNLEDWLAVQANRHQGVYRTLTAYRLKRIAELGLPAVIHCLEKTSAPICLKLGFEKVCEIDSYEPQTT